MLVCYFHFYGNYSSTLDFFNFRVTGLLPTGFLASIHNHVSWWGLAEFAGIKFRDDVRTKKQGHRYEVQI